jgi:AcrR family transcriptional regulator
MNDTRERILQTALDLFIEQGYDKASLREVAERVGVTKAALYYHFASKEEILRTLMQPILELQTQAMALINERPSLEAWGAGLTTLVQWVLPQRRLFELLEKNQGPARAITEKMMAGHGSAEHEFMHERLYAVFTNQAMPLSDRVRMAGAVGLVMGVLGLLVGKAFIDVPADELQSEVIDAINDVLRIGKTAPAPAARDGV